ncbi:roundabout-like protein 2 [Elysia marginata]|uniref:Roundabout-like protein 2 n=1 Tax=Elysia marginata TaxID=1093978 RepID=A0AAV4G8S1_9GAST|nr:roundabout-like protein 2 [Elysia marginata]
MLYYYFFDRPVSYLSQTDACKVLEDDFKKSPTSQVKAVGERAEFQCIPPYGAPRATVQWAHEGQLLDPVKDRTIIVTDRDSLVIPSVEAKNAGEYTCVASNKGGEKESDPAVLTVLEKPYFVEMPAELKVSVDATVELKCKAAGDPKPTVQWHKEDGRIAFGRARQLDDGTLRIEKVQIGDEGVYVCVAENVAGTAEAVGKLEVETRPSFLIPPKDITVALGRTAVLQCVVTGNPEPTVFWNIGNDKQLMFPNQPIGRFNMSDDGTLRIHDVTFSDQGTYECKALNVLGKANHSATVTVTSDDDRLPPIIVAGPQNQTISPGKVALLTCLVRSPKSGPAPQVTWYKDGALLLVSTDTRVTELNSGTLQISDVRPKDSGRYTCKAVSETGETEWSAFLIVSKQGTSHRSPPKSAFPDAPIKLRVSDIADTSVRLTWTASDRPGQEDVEGYVVEYFSPQTSGGWQTASDTVSLDGYTVKNLQPDTKYVFMVRAKNAMGVGPPSAVSNYVTTRAIVIHFGTSTERRRNLNVNLPKEEIARELKKLRIELKQGQGTNATHIKVKWEIRDSLSAVEGYMVNYTYLIDLDPMTYGTTEVIKVADAFKLRVKIGGLRPASWYQVCVRAYAKGQTSPWSNSINILTMESIPSRPPTNIMIQEEDNSFHIEWSPPDPAYQNGEIIGYDIDCMSKVDQTNCSTRVKGRDTSVVISKATVDGSYRIRVAARTSKGRGVWSNEIIMGERTRLYEMIRDCTQPAIPLAKSPEAKLSAWCARSLKPCRS